MSRRVFCALPLIAAGTPSRAEPERTAPVWPRRPVRLVTRPADGVRNDAMARTLAAALSRRWRQPVLVDYRPGGDGTASVETFLAAHDDHALLLGSTGVWTTLHLTHDNLPFDPERDLVPLAPVVQDYIAIAVAPALGLATLGEVIDAAHRNPGKLTWSSSLHAPYLAFLAFLKAVQAEFRFAPCRNPLGAAADLAEGRVDLAFLTLPPTIGATQPGRIRLVAVTSTERAPSALDVPTVVEAGFPALAMQSGYSLFGPRDMPVPLRARIADDVAAAVRDPVVAQRLALMGYRPQLGSPAAFQALLQRERAHWSELAHASYATTAAQ
ncbi:tripartite tricarboxylate transporter substrate binding protein [Reyranella sp.]|uniref:Bug family tripartite tricarboxylate transporter substrate binding protein n=1 Tax=Reyranella sp. TaxID=1929291 RepID=UPI0025E96264|nr:tripartite tricarboxylate transporter substrate binding protein [Reyranella sp.]